MSRSGYSDDGDYLPLWRGAVDRAWQQQVMQAAIDYARAVRK